MRVSVGYNDVMCAVMGIDRAVTLLSELLFECCTVFASAQMRIGVSLSGGGGDLAS